MKRIFLANFRRIISFTGILIFLITAMLSCTSQTDDKLKEAFKNPLDTSEPDSIEMKSSKLDSGQKTVWYDAKHFGIAPAEIAHRSITMSHLGNVAMELNQDLEWDPKTEQILNNDKANSMLTRMMREPWASVYKKYTV